jgi:hypothetical protein
MVPWMPWKTSVAPKGVHILQAFRVAVYGFGVVLIMGFTLPVR